ncbi:MAG: DUF5906 domain-containing protein [Gallionella sp.]
MFQPSKTNNVVSLNRTASNDKNDSLDVQYANYCLNNGFCLATKDESVVHKWDGSCWQTVTQDDFETDAFVWIQSSREAKKASSPLAQRLVKGVPLMLRHHQKVLPQRPRWVEIVPLKNAYLIMQDGEQSFSIIPPNPEYGMTHCVNASLSPDELNQQVYIPKSVNKNTLFHQFLESSFPDLEVRSLAQEMMASTILQKNFQKATVLMGDGNNGKGVLHKIMASVHERTIAKELDHLNDSHDLENIVGATLILVDETPESRIHVQRFKSLVSQDIVTINPKGKKAFSYTPIAKWIINGNHHIVTRDQSYGFWRRIVPIPVNVKITNKIPNLAEQIIEKELKEVIDWLLEGAVRIIKRGRLLEEHEWPKAVRCEINTAQTSADSVMAFSEEFELKINDGESWVSKEDIYKDYVRYCDDYGLMSVSNPNFFKRLLKTAERQHVAIKERQKSIGTANGTKRIRQISVTYFNASCKLDNSNPVDGIDDVPYNDNGV